ncbi:cation:proton antiporter [Pararhodobacter sp. SW119]|uniref:cation:proton antiporter n=1 Tax=Pararhodobacter sp. SW119 TaxID=2780075 RepID=UPI001ADF4962|nr:cation:proton antiporter [Pararhodobacter sp. SW119]
MELFVIVAIIAALFAVIGLAEPVAARLRLPATVILAVLGTGIGGSAAFFLHTGFTDAFDPVAEAILALPIRSNLFLYVFLPTLIFQVALTLDVRRMMDDWMPILVLSVLAVGVATVVVGYALFAVAGLSLMVCLMVGAIVSTTDPSAVVGIFRSTPAPQRLARIVEGESLLNDAAAIALFGLFFAFIAIGVPSPSLGEALLEFPWLVAGGVFVGWAAARLMLPALSRLGAHPLGQVSLSVALPYLVFVLAENGLGVSGVIAVVAAGLTLNFLGPGQLSPQAVEKLRDTWDLLGYWAGGLIFVLAALLIPRLLADLRLFDLVLIGVTVLAALAARALILFGLLPVLTTLRLSPQVEPRYRVAILWGGLRGAVTLALALAVTESFRIPPDVKRQVAIIATGFTLFTLLVQGTTLRLMIARLGLNRLSPIDTALSAQVVAVALQTVRDTVSEAARDMGLTRETVRDEAKRYAERVDAAVHAAEEAAGILDRDRITLGLVALAGRERDLIIDDFRERTIPARLANRLLLDTDRLIEATRTGGRLAYLNEARRRLRAARGQRVAEFLHNRLRLSGPLSSQTADRFERLVAVSLILKQLHGFIDTRIRRIHGKRVADLLHDLLERRAEETEQALEGLRLQFPGYAEQLERRLIRQIVLAQEEREYAALVEDGLIGPELWQALLVRIQKRRDALEVRPPLDLAVQKSELVRQFPLFADMDEAQRRRLARRLRTVYAAPGDRLLKRGENPRRVWFIASGAVEVERGTQIVRLGRGEMFGHLALLRRSARRGQITAITHCTLLALDEAQFLSLLGRNKALRAAVLASAEKRGVTLDLTGLTEAA